MSLKRLLPEKITNIKAWSDLSDAVESIFSSQVWDPTIAISNLRDPEIIEKEYLSLLGGLLGFDIKSDIFAEDDYRRLLSELSKYYEKTGTDALAHFMSYVKNTEVRLTPQWSNDYITFHDAPLGTTIYDGGDWFLTPHVLMRYDLERVTGHLSDADSFYMFYQLAPIHLVLDRIVEFATARANVYLNGGISIRQVYHPTNNAGQLRMYMSSAMRIIQMPLRNNPITTQWNIPLVTNSNVGITQ
jgi:hypothetical protein